MSACEEWQGYRNPDGYGIQVVNGRRERAHRVAWVKANGPIPDGMRVLHSCDNPPCVLIEHLFLGTQGDNVRDARDKRRLFHLTKTHCPAGHPYDEENTYVYPNGSHRGCHACRRIRRAK